MDYREIPRQMNNARLVGKTFYARGDATVEWKISDFLSLPNIPDVSYISPTIDFDGSLWYLKLYPNGLPDNDSPDWLGLSLIRRDASPPRTIRFALGIGGSDGVRMSVHMEFKFSPNDRGWRYGLFLSRSKLNERKSILMPNNVLTIICEFETTALKTADKSELQKSLLTVLESGEDSDVVIKMKGKEFPVHRAILRARSPVFRSMFTHELLEKQKGVVTIDDLDPETFPNFLAHVYSGICDQISTRNVCSLYTTADKFDFSDLKEECEKFMKVNFTVSCFCDFITLAVKHDLKDLIECATQFFSDNSFEISKAEGWQTFSVENPIVESELLIRSLVKHMNTT